MAAATWPVETSDRTAAVTKSNIGRVAKTPNVAQLPLNAWLLYRARFVSAADICSACSRFGGLAAQLNNLSPIPHLATTESNEAALFYGSLLSDRLEELARSRAERSAAVIDFDELLSVGQTRFKLQAITQAAKKEPAVEKVEKVDKKVKKEVDPLANKSPGWLPKKEYLGKLAADRAADQKKDTRRKSAQRSRSRSKRRERTPKRGRTPVRETMKRHRRWN